MPPGSCDTPERRSASTGPQIVLVADPNRMIKRRRPKTYDRNVLKPLLKIWAILDCPCSLKLKPKAKTKPRTLLKVQIPIRTFADWKEDEPGFV
jgi:hypothetical protein